MAPNKCIQESYGEPPTVLDIEVVVQPQMSSGDCAGHGLLVDEMPDTVIFGWSCKLLRLKHMNQTLPQT